MYQRVVRVAELRFCLSKEEEERCDGGQGDSL